MRQAVGKEVFTKLNLCSQDMINNDVRGIDRGRHWLLRLTNFISADIYPRRIFPDMLRLFIGH